MDSPSLLSPTIGPWPCAKPLSIRNSSFLCLNNLEMTYHGDLFPKRSIAGLLLLELELGEEGKTGVPITNYPKMSINNLFSESNSANIN